MAPPVVRAATPGHWWTAHQSVWLYAAIAVLTACAVLKLSDSFWQLAFGAPGGWGGIDVRNRHYDVHMWFAGQPIYALSKKAVYPPASLPIFWLMVGWLDVPHARWLWAVCAAIATGALVHLLIAESGAENRAERLLVALLALSMSATGVAIRNGQPIIFLLPLLLIVVRRMRRMPVRWLDDALIAALLLVMMVKPTNVVPFVWLVLFAGRWRSIVALGAGYLALTLFAVSFQSASLEVLLHQWLRRCLETSSLGYAHVHVWLAMVGLPGWNMPASALLLLALGVWTYRHQRTDVWIVLGVSAFVTRVWTYHQLHDDMLMLLPMLALFRLAHGRADRIAGTLLVTMAAVMIIPESTFYGPARLALLYSLVHVAAFVSVTGFLVMRAETAPAVTTPAPT